MSGPKTPGDDAGSGADSDPSHAGDEFPSRAYSAPESEQITSAPYVPADSSLYDYDNYESVGHAVPDPRPPRWPWVVGVTAIIAAIALVVSVALLVTKQDTSTLATPAPTTTSGPPVQDEITTTTTTAPPEPSHTTTEAAPPPPPPSSTEAPPPTTTTAPPPVTTTTHAGPRQVTYSVTGTKAPGDIISVTYIDASGRQRTQRNVYIPWSLTVTPISTSEVGSVQASSLFLVSRLNCSITTSDGTVLSSNNSNTAQTSC